MFLLFILSLSVIIYLIGLELDKPAPPCAPLLGACPGCACMVESGWLICPQCRALLREACRECGKIRDCWLSYCPWCRHQNEKACK